MQNTESLTEQTIQPHTSITTTTNSTTALLTTFYTFDFCLTGQFFWSHSRQLGRIPENETF